MSDYGFTPQGFVPKPTAVILAELQSSLHGLYGAGVPLGAATYLGTMSALIADRAGSLWDLLQAAVSAGDPDAAEDAALEVIALYRLVFREGVLPSLARLTLTGVAGTAVARLSRVSISDTTVAFATDTTATLTAVPARAPSAVVPPDALRSNSGAVYYTVTGGTTGAGAGPSGSGAAIADGSVTWSFVGTGGAAARDVLSYCTTDGPVPAPAGSLTQIDTFVAGWQGATNLLDAELGALRQTDESLRYTSEASLAGPGTGTPEAIRSALLRLTGVRGCTVFSNRGDTTDADGVPPKSIEVLITGGDDGAIARTIYEEAGAAEGLAGSTSVTITDSEGFPQIIRFTRPTIVPIYVAITVGRDAARYPAGGAAAVSNLLVNYGDAQHTGSDVLAFTLAGQAAPRIQDGVLREQVPGVTQVKSCAVGTAPSPSGSSVTITRRQFGDLDSSRVAVVEEDPS